MFIIVFVTLHIALKQKKKIVSLMSKQVSEQENRKAKTIRHIRLRTHTQ